MVGIKYGRCHNETFFRLKGKRFHMTNNILIVSAPPLWQKLPPLGPACLSGYLESRGVQCGVLDLNAFFFNLVGDKYLKSRWTSSVKDIRADLENLFIKAEAPLKRLLSAIKDGCIGAVGFSIFNLNLKLSVYLAREIRTAYPDITIIAGGPEVDTHFYNNYISLFDFFVRGEGELALYELLADPADDYRGRFIEGKEAPLDNYPPPDFMKFNLDEYESKGSLPVILSRGCLYKCRFCAERLHFKKYRCKSAESMFGELICLQNKMGISRFVFYDSIINGDLRVLEKLCDLITADGLKITWEAQASVRRDMPERLFSKMKEAGCYNLFVGIESGSDTVLRKMRKGYGSRDALPFLEKCSRSGLNFEISLITGFPGEGDEEFEETLNFLTAGKGIIKKVAQINPFIGYRNLDMVGYAPPPPGIAEKRVARLLAALEENGIKYTRSYINNLTGYIKDI